MTTTLYVWLLYIAKVLFVPVMILALWRKHPVLSYILAAVVHYALMVYVKFSIEYGMATLFGGTPPRLPFVRRAFLNTHLTLILFLPVLLGFQLVLRRLFVKRDKHKKMSKVFS